MLYILSALRKQDEDHFLVIHKWSCSEVTKSSSINFYFFFNLESSPLFPRGSCELITSCSTGLRKESNNCSIQSSLKRWVNNQPQLMHAHMHTRAHTEALWWTTRFMSEVERSVNALSKTELHSLKPDTSPREEGLYLQERREGRRKIERKHQQAGEGFRGQLKCEVIQQLFDTV